MDLTPTRPYLIRAFHEWILDNDLTPYLLVDAEVNGVQVPIEFVTEGKIVLNLSPSAIRSPELGNEWISFNARFGGVARDIFVPVHAVRAIYAQENGKGMVFHDEDSPLPPPPPSKKKDVSGGAGKPDLRVVK